MLVVGGAVAGLVAMRVVSSEQGTRSVLVAAHDMAAGHVLQSSDLVASNVSATGLDLISESQQASLTGRPLAVALPGGAPLVGADIGAAPTALRGTTSAAVLVKAGQFPPSLAVGDRVSLVDTGSALGGSTPTAIVDRPVSATVLRVDAPNGTGVSADSGTVVTLQLSNGDAAGVARAAAVGHIAILQSANG